MCKIFVLGLLLFLCGCATIGNKNIMDQQKVSQIKRGETTKEQVRSNMGAPSDIAYIENDGEVWKYTVTKSKTRATAYIPIVGMFFGGADVETRTLTIKFDKNGIVKDFGESTTKGGMGSVLD